MYLISPYIAARAQLVTFILFTLEIYCIERFLDSPKIRYGAFLIIIAAVIAQLHVAVFPMFFIFTLPYLAEYLFAVICDSNLEQKIVKLVFGIIVKFAKKEETKKEDKIDYAVGFEFAKKVGEEVCATLPTGEVANIRILAKNKDIFEEKEEVSTLNK